MLELSSRTFKAMGSRCELHLYLPLDVPPEPLIGRLIGEVERLEAKYSRYRPTSVVSEINDAAGKGKLIEVDEETTQLLDYADALYDQSDGMFDITSGVLRRVWDFRSNCLPSSEAVSSILPLIDWPSVIRDANAIALPREGMQIDFGGFGKEYAVDVLAAHCVDEGVTHGLVNLGGDVCVVGPHPDGSPWRVGIQHPRAPGESIAVVELERGAVATSGDYERFMEIDGKRYSHLLNPMTGESLQPRFASVSVLADRCLVAGSFSTVAMLMTEGAAEWLESAGLPHLLVSQSAEISGSGLPIREEGG